MSKDENQYQPISCELYSEFELAIIQHKKIKLVWREGDQHHIAVVTPLDLITEDHQEFMIAQDHRKQLLRVRLDYICSQEFI